jgi:predicted RecB family nuclease
MMATKITRAIIESYLNCKYKGHLKLAGEGGTKSDYEVMTAAARAASREQAIASLVARFGEGDACRGTTVTAATLKKGAPLLTDANLEDEGLSLLFDGLKRVDGPSRLGEHYYLPVLHHHGDKVGQRQKLLLAVLGLMLDRLQGLRPAFGLVARGPEGRLGKVRLDARIYRQAGQVLDEVKRLQQGGEPPRLTLNGHCQVCEFRQRCRTQAEQADDISLLGGVGEKELQRYHRKGIFTLTQLSCTFRARKKSKRVKRSGHVRYSALQALAIREKKVHVYGTPDLPRKPVQVFLDAEGNEDGSFAYLLGVLVGEGDTQKSYSFWADGPDEEVEVFDAFLDLLDGHEDFVLFHYGSYEKALLRRMRKVVKRKRLVDRALAKSVNVLSVIHASVYFPTFSNGLKEVGRYLGRTWTEGDASGLQSLVWRARWEQAREPVWKEKLLTYNAEDCAALWKVAEFVHAVGEVARRRGAGTGDPAPSGPAVAWADEVAAPSSRREWCRVKFALEDFDHVNRCAWFDYQREKVFLRTSKAVRKACLRHRKRRKRAKLPVNKEVEIRSSTCPRCKGKRLTRLYEEMHYKLAYDLKFTAGGIRRQVIRCTTACHRCEDCNLVFLPKRYKRRDKHLHGLKSWAMYQHVAHRISLQHLEVMFEDCFGLRVNFKEIHMLKSLMARRYRPAYKRILDRIVRGELVHGDETHVNLQKGKGYVWALTNLEDVHYLYRPSREADFLQDLLDDFKGVLVTDFYTGYDSLPCDQQKCLVHLIRDFNGDLMGNPYDEEFKALVGEFGKLLRSIVSTIDKYGLKKRHLHKHKAAVAQFFRALETRVYRSELAKSYQKRLATNEGKLFTFLDHDGVPWNNNNAEHAIKAFAYYRRVSDGKMREEGLSDFLVLLSVYQTCKYRGVSFLKFLLSREDDVEAYCQRRRKKMRPPRLEIYPKGFPPKYRKPHCDDKGGNGDRRPRRVRWKLAILAFLRTRPETGTGRCDITEYCLGLIRDGILVTAAPADDRLRVDRIVYMYLYAMKKAGEVIRAPGKVYFATVRGLAWLERHPAPVADIRQPDEPAPTGKPGGGAHSAEERRDS